MSERTKEYEIPKLTYFCGECQRATEHFLGVCQEHERTGFPRLVMVHQVAPKGRAA